MSGDRSIRTGIYYMIVTTVMFSIMDATARCLGEKHGVLMIMLVRYWFTAAFVIWFAMRHAGGLKAAAATNHLWLQILRGLLLVAEVFVMLLSFVLLGLVESHAVFTCYPLIVAALSVPILREKVGWRRWIAIGVGLVGVLIILGPGFGVFHPLAGLPLLSATLFALYGVLTRYVSRKDDANTSFFWTGIVGAVVITIVGLPHWTAMPLGDWGWLMLFSILGLVGHWTLIKAYEAAEASAVQPFAFLQLIWSSALGIWIFGEHVTLSILVGASLVLGAGLFTLWREQHAKA